MLSSNLDELSRHGHRETFTSRDINIPCMFASPISSYCSEKRYAHPHPLPLRILRSHVISAQFGRRKACRSRRLCAWSRSSTRTSRCRSRRAPSRRTTIYSSLRCRVVLHAVRNQKVPRQELQREHKRRHKCKKNLAEKGDSRRRRRRRGQRAAHFVGDDRSGPGADDQRDFYDGDEDEKGKGGKGKGTSQYVS